MGKKVLRYALIALGIIVAVPLCVFAYWRLTYYSEMHSIERKLNHIPGVNVVNIWGHDDISLEEVTARLRVQGKGEIVLYGLSRDVLDYPNTVWISEIDGLSFTVFYKNGVGSDINIGRKGHFGRFFPFTFERVEDVVNQYTHIAQTVRSWPQWPELLHFYSSQGEEVFVAVQSHSKADRDPIYELVGVEDKFKYAEALPWGTKE